MATNFTFPVDELIAPANPTTPMANAIIAGQAAELPTRSAANINAPYPDDELTNLSGQPDLWATEDNVEDIIAPISQDQDITKVVEKEVLRAEAMVLVTNLAEKQTATIISDLTTKVLEGYKTDLASRKEWEELNKQIIDLAKLLVKKKVYAGEVVANVKYPIIINACIQFASRAYPELIKGNDIVKAKIVGND